MSTIMGVELDPGFCSALYNPPFIPYFGEESAFSLITVCLELLILLFLLSCILRKKWYQCRGDDVSARSLLLPAYDRVLYYYCIVTLVRIVFYSLQFVYEMLTPNINTADPDYQSPSWVLLGDTIGVLGIIGLQVFILLLLMQTSAGTKAFSRAFKATIAFVIVEAVLILLKHFGGGPNGDLLWFCIGELAEEALLLSLFLGVLCYAYCYQTICRHRKRRRNRILLFYIIALSILFSIVIVAYGLLIFGIDGYCLDIIEQYLYRLLFPLIAFMTIRSDSEFWRLLLLQWQTSSSQKVGEDGEENDNIWHKIKSIFGTMGSPEGRPSFLNPLIDALSMGVKMVDFAELQETSDPIAMGSTATVSKAKYKGETVAIKVFIFDELSLEVVSEFFRESLLISDLHHENIVEFKGACLRPPELCLVYEYCCCGDLTHLLLTQYFHSQFMHHEEDEDDDEEEEREDPKLFRHRLKMLMDVAKGMSRLHDSGIIHRDLKTSNVLVHFKNGKYVAKVCDFGSARKLLKDGAKGSGSGSNGKYTPPPGEGRVNHAKSTDALTTEQDQLSTKQVVKSIQKKMDRKTKKHEIVVENKKIQRRAGTVDNARDRGTSSKSKKSSRSNTVNLSTGIFGHRARNKKRKEQQSKASNRGHSGPQLDRKPSATYYDAEEEEKYQRPNTITNGGDDIDDADPQIGNGVIRDDISEATDDVMTELNIEKDRERDPYTLAFSVSPIRLTTQVGTLAFMAPEILSHVNIAGLQGGWVDVPPENDNTAAIIEEDVELDVDEKDEEKESMKARSITAHKTAQIPYPAQSEADPHSISRNLGAGNMGIAGMNSMASKPGTDWASSDSESHGGSINSVAQSDTIVIKIDTKTDPNYMFSGPQANSLSMLHEATSSASSSNRVVVPRSPIPAKTAPIRIPQRGDRRSKSSLTSRTSMEMGAVGRSQRSQRRRDIPNIKTHSNLSSNRSRIGPNSKREYMAKHRGGVRLNGNQNQRGKMAEAPNRALPSLPPPGSGRNASNSIHSAVSGLSSSLKRRFMTPGSYGSNSQRLDVHFYNGSSHRSHRGLNHPFYLNAFDEYSQRPLPLNPRSVHPQRGGIPHSLNQQNVNGNPMMNMNLNVVPSPMMRAQAPVLPMEMRMQNGMMAQSMRRNQMGFIPHSYGAPQPPMAMQMGNREMMDPRFSTMSSSKGNQFGLRGPRNVSVYRSKPLPKDPAKSLSARPKPMYHARGRSQSKFSRDRRGSLVANNRLVLDDAASMVYDTQQFEIIYEPSSTALYDRSVDVYSFGVIMWETGLCDRIYNQMDMKAIRDMVCEGKRMPTPSYKECKAAEDNGLAGISRTVYNAFIELVNDCWAQSPIDRPKFYEVVERLQLIQNLYEMKMERKREKQKQQQYQD